MQERVARFKDQFSGTRQLDGVTSAAAGLAAPVFYAVSAAAAAGAALGGYAVATKAPLEGMGFCTVYLPLCRRSPGQTPLKASICVLVVTVARTVGLVHIYGRLIFQARRNTVECITPTTVHVIDRRRALLS